jgi:hypothetical protein
MSVRLSREACTNGNKCDIVSESKFPVHAGARLSLSAAYSPDRNPIENALVKFEAIVRAAAARTFDTLEAAAVNALAKVRPAECVNFFAHAGYGFN